MKVLTYLEEDNTYSVIIHIKDLFDQPFNDTILSLLEDSSDWEKGEIRGNPIKRVQKWYQVNNRYFGIGWHRSFPRWTAKTYPDWLIDLQKRMNDTMLDLFEHLELVNRFNISPPDINSVLVNKYRNGSDAISPHKDDERIFGDNPTIISYSLGSTRQFVMQRSIYNPANPKSCKLEPDSSPIVFNLESGDVLIMAGSCQKYFCHSIEKSVDDTPRYNFTFREHLS